MSAGAAASLLTSPSIASGVPSLSSSSSATSSAALRNSFSTGDLVAGSGSTKTGISAFVWAGAGLLIGAILAKALR
jgi:hypothetical protein